MKKILITLALLIALSAGVWFFVLPLFGEPKKAEVPYVVPPMGEVYTNNQYNFSLQLPQGFTVREVEDEFSSTILLEDNQANGVQIVVTPLDEDIRVLTAERIRADIPGMSVSDAQTLEVGEDYIGVAFKSNNDAFGGASREVWFAFRNNLYQISTYERLDELLKAIFATWKFF